MRSIVPVVIVGALLAGMVTVGGLGSGMAAALNGSYVQAYNQNNLIRFHVIANSDTPRDQALKRRVRDLIVREMSPAFSQAKNITEARLVAGNHLAAIEELARKEVRASGEEYQVKAMLGKYSFPTKSYGKFTLPAGEYEAVRVIIGNGAGANWWCVLFPPTCFVDVSKELGKAEYTGPVINTLNADMAPEDEWPTQVEPETRFEVRFRILDLLKQL